MSHAEQTDLLIKEIAVGVTTEKVRERLVSALAEREIQSRVDLLDGALKKRAEQLIELRKAERPDQVSYDSEGKVTSELFSKDKVEALKKAREQLEKTERAIEQGLGGDFKKLKELK